MLSYIDCSIFVKKYPSLNELESIQLSSPSPILYLAIKMNISRHLPLFLEVQKPIFVDECKTKI